MDEESSISNSSFNDQENDENFLDKENQRSEQNSDDNDEQHRHIYEQQQYQRSQFYQQQQIQQQQSTYHGFEEASNQSIMDENLQDEEMDYANTDRTPKPVPHYLIEKIDNEKWPGVNGYYNSSKEWKEWHETASEINPYSNELLVILPYVPFVTNTTSISLDISC